MKKTHRSNLAAGVRRQAIVILGMHRSGTSALGGVLNILGASAPKTLMPPTAANPRGYWESTRLMAAHDALLQAAGSSWDDWRRIDLERIDPGLLKQHREEIKKIISEEFEDSPLFFVKDPRVCRFFPLTLDILNEMNIRTVVYHIIRNPLEVAHSLKQRDGLSLPKSLLLWLRHTLEAEYRSRNLPRYFIPYEEFLTGWQKYLDLAAVETGIRFPMASEKSAADIERFLTSTLRHERFTFEEMQASPAFASWASEIYRIIRGVSERGEKKDLLHQLDLLRAKFEESCAVFGESLIENETEVRELSADMTKQSDELALLQARTQQLEVTNQQSRTEIGLLQAQQLKDAHLARLLHDTISQLEAERREKESVRVRALWRHPLNSKKRKEFREYYTNVLSQIQVGGKQQTNKTANIAAIIKHPFSSKRRKKYREQTKEVISREPDRLERSFSEPFVQIYEQYVKAALPSGSNEWSAPALKPPPANRCDVKLVAYYLPQYHPIPENDSWWGLGFTEWCNVAKAIPAFVGHYQPRQPGELGFYDLRVVDVMRRQVELAKLYGISAFCFHFYWFGGKRLLELPVNNYLENKDLDLPFCFCWANENWSRRWDGSEEEILIAQSHSAEDDISFIRYLKRYFDDPRYLKIDGKPVLTVYRPAILPDINATVARWRREIRNMGFPGLYLVATNSFGFLDYRQAGFDALSEFPPHALPAHSIKQHCVNLHSNNTGEIYSYDGIVANEKMSGAVEGDVIFPGVMPAWDNTARRPLRGNVFHGSTPALFERWLEASMERAMSNRPGEKIVMVNAWNEWAEGAYLEPDRRYGYAYLSACGTAIRKHANRDPRVAELFQNQRRRFRKKSSKAIALHLFYEDLAPQFRDHFDHFDSADLFITVNDDISWETAQFITSIFPQAYFLETENRGRDIAAFLSILEALFLHDYDYICKIHSKKSAHLKDGGLWRDEVVSSLLSQDSSQALKRFQNDRKVGILAVSNSMMALTNIDVRLHTEKKMTELTQRMGIQFNTSDKFAAGSMFWFRPDALEPFIALYKQGIEFELELGQIDGTTSHAIERLFLIVAKSQGYSVREFGKPVKNPYG